MKRNIILSVSCFIMVCGLFGCNHVNTDIVEDAVVTEATTTSSVTTSETTSETSVTTSTKTTTSAETTELATSLTREAVVEAIEAVFSETENSSVAVVEVVNIPVEEYLVYKPSTHYIHKNTCHWNSGDAYRCDSFDGIEARLCNECNPNAEGFIEYVEPEPVYSTVYLSDSDKYYLAVMICHECSPRAGAVHNAGTVGAMVNYGGSIYNAISNSCSPYWEYGHGSWCMSNGCFNDVDSSYAYEAIDYYLSHPDDYAWITGWCASGDEIYNSYN